MLVSVPEREQLLTSIHEGLSQGVQQICILHCVSRSTVQMVPLQETKTNSNDFRRRVLYLLVSSHCVPRLDFGAEQVMNHKWQQQQQVTHIRCTNSAVQLSLVIQRLKRLASSLRDRNQGVVHPLKSARNITH